MFISISIFLFCTPLQLSEFESQATIVPGAFRNTYFMVSPEGTLVAWGENHPPLEMVLSDWGGGAR